MDMVDIVDFMENPWAPVDSSLFVAIPDICEFLWTTALFWPVKRAPKSAKKGTMANNVSSTKYMK